MAAFSSFVAQVGLYPNFVLNRGLAGRVSERQYYMLLLKVCKQFKGDAAVFGPHLVAEAYGIDKRWLKDVGYLYKLLDMYPSLIGMTKIAPPWVFEYTGSVPEDWGVSGIVLIAESHIGVHLFPEKGFATLDIFSCLDFNTDEALKIFKAHFNPENIEHHVLMRGREFPRSESRAALIVESERRKFI